MFDVYKFSVCIYYCQEFLAALLVLEAHEKGLAGGFMGGGDGLNHFHLLLM